MMDYKKVIVNVKKGVYQKTAILSVRSKNLLKRIKVYQINSNMYKIIGIITAITIIITDCILIFSGKLIDQNITDNIVVILPTAMLILVLLSMFLLSIDEYEHTPIIVNGFILIMIIKIAVIYTTYGHYFTNLDTYAEDIRDSTTDTFWPLIIAHYVSLLVCVTIALRTRIIEYDFLSTAFTLIKAPIVIYSIFAFVYKIVFNPSIGSTAISYSIGHEAFGIAIAFLMPFILAMIAPNQIKSK